MPEYLVLVLDDSGKIVTKFGYQHGDWYMVCDARAYWKSHGYGVIVALPRLGMVL